MMSKFYLTENECSSKLLFFVSIILPNTYFIKNFFKKFFLPGITIFLLLIGLLHYQSSLARASEPKIIAVSQFLSHPALNAVREGLEDYLNKSDYEIGNNLKYFYSNAQGNIVTSAQIAQKFAGLNSDVIVAISTPSAQTVLTAVKEGTPIVFTAITDPISAKLVNDLTKPGKNITGVTDFPPIDKQLNLVKEILPTIRSLGILYNPGEPNSVSLVKVIKQRANELDIKIVEAAVTKSTEVSMATQKLVNDTDAIFVPLDNTVASAISQVIKVSLKAGKATFVSDRELVSRGALACVGFSYYELGQKTGELVVRILDGEKPGNIPIESPDTQELFINMQSAKKIGLKIPQDLIEKAKLIY